MAKKSNITATKDGLVEKSTGRKIGSPLDDAEFFLVDEVAMLRFISMCQESYTPDLWEAAERACRLLIHIRSGFRNDSFERIENYLHGAKQPQVLDA